MLKLTEAGLRKIIRSELNEMANFPPSKIGGVASDKEMKAQRAVESAISTLQSAISELEMSLETMAGEMVDRTKSYR